MSDTPQTMSGVQLVAHGGPEALVWNDSIPVPRPAPGQILVRVLAAGVNNTDINTRIGWYSKEVTGATADSPGAPVEAGGWAGALNFPLIQGADLCGLVVALGSQVTSPSIGARVTVAGVQDWSTPEEPKGMRTLGSEMDGAFAEYCLLEADQVFEVSDSPLTDIEIAAMPCAHGTAWGMISRASVGPGDTIFVSGASGGVGLAAVGLCKHLGARVIAQSATAKADAVRAAGAEVVLDRGVLPAPDTVDVWIDLVGGPDWGATFDAMRPGGRIAIAGAIAGPIAEIDLRTVYLRDLTIFGCTHQPRTTFASLVDMMIAGDVRPLVSRTYPLKDIAIAQQDFSSKRYPGKLVLIP